MREFKFGGEKTEFLFNNEVFAINVTKAGSVMGKVGELLNEAAENGDVIEKNINEVLNLLDDVLGEGRIDKMFAGRAIEVGDVCDLVNFISAEVMEYNKTKKREVEAALAKAQTRRFVAVK